MNTASRMESTGKKGFIQLSQQTADILVEAGRSSWIIPREDKVEAKGKGEMQTYFLKIQMKSDKSETGSFGFDSSMKALDSDDKDEAAMLIAIDKRNRSARWVVEILANLLREMAAKREASGIRNKDPITALDNLEMSTKGNGNSMVIDEVKEIITIPGFSKNGKNRVDKDKVDLGSAVLEELKDYVLMAASLYNDNSFHW